MLDEIHWLLDHAQLGRFQGQALLHHHSTWRYASVTTTSDASGVTGAVGVACGHASLHARLPTLKGSNNVVILEALGPVLAWLRWGDLAPGALWRAAVDSIAVAYGMNSGRLKRGAVADLTAVLYHLADDSGSEFVFFWLSRVANYLCDRIASCRSTEARAYAPWVQCLGDFNNLQDIILAAGDQQHGPGSKYSAAAFIRTLA